MLMVKQVLQALQQKSILEADTVAELDAVLKARDIAPTHPFIADDASGGTPGSKPMRNGSARLDKRQVEQRIEEDRERHKRARESIWAVPGEDTEEMDRLWDDASDIGEDDYLGADEDAGERRQAISLG
jgi:CTD kinase subunit gamma